MQVKDLRPMLMQVKDSQPTEKEQIEDFQAARGLRLKIYRTKSQR